MNIKFTEAALFALLSSAGLFGAGYGYGKIDVEQLQPISLQGQALCLIPKDVAKSTKPRSVS
jgi:hypothetical protein